MEEIEYYDLSKIIKVKIRDKIESLRFEYKPFSPKKWWFGSDVKEGFYDYYDRILYDDSVYDETFLKDLGYIVEDKRVFNKPYIEINFLDKYVFKKTFGSVEEAKDWYRLNLESKIDLTTFVDV
jgi:hypothetical protein